MKFKTERISEHITRIYGFCTEMMYLVEGEKDAVLIDTGSGYFSLKQCVDQLTDKPVKVLMTHGHVDHAMGAGEFEEIYLNHKDEAVYREHAKKEFRLEGLAGIILLFSGIQRFITDVMAAYMVGAIILIYGIFQIAAGTKVYKTSKGKGILSIVCGVLSVIVSIISFTHPILTMISAGYMIAFSVLMQGINMIVLGINFGKTEN